MATKEASSSKKPAAASSGKPTGKPAASLSPKAAAAAIRIADNKKATFNYHIEERFEAGMVLEGWEVKSVREGKVQLTDGYVVIRNGELFIIGCQINPLGTASTHIRPDSVRTK
ncbi:MAG: SsrA-binding protein, partial [Polaromonas sp.]|nr:SsrA-binding protein [Polaromonas sp.]